ncbi:hypothetical protein BT63DRAFT_427132 [Microthyrium microscopicum]|uniref:RRM domain-containing protein n=1 Tax=Microthyrium microscopicum TaxID=703497 RepID=A0A6A6U5Z1_9PEZI|nr:hypothetical protein BT63DRAFT_427132 [Microthyrium microscopicum]
MSSSPPQEPLDTRHAKSLTPQSPKPLTVPSPSNIPILERQMDAAAMSIESAETAVIAPATIHTDNSAPGFDNPSTKLENFTNGGGNFGVSPVLANGSVYPQYVGADQTQLALSSPTLNEATSLSSSSLANVTETHENTLNNPNSSTIQASESANQPEIVPSLKSPVNIQALLDSLGPNFAANLTPIKSTDDALVASIPNNAPSLPSTSLPARPPPQEKPSTHPNYAPEDDIRSYHPHSHNNSGSAQYRASQSTQQPLPPGNNNAPANNQHQRTPSLNTMQSPPGGSHSGPGTDEEETQFNPDLEYEYEQFVREERANVAEGKWEKFPDGSRLFIGNLPTEKVSKRDVFRRFRPYGKLGQISLKQAYGFVQFLEVNSCERARDNEQDKPLKGRKMHLEISRPQGKGTRDRNAGRRRSRSPDRDRGRNDRYSDTAQSPRDRLPRRGRDDYRPGRSPSPRGFRRARSPDHYDGRRRSRTPPGRGGRHSDQRREPDDDLPLPYRSPQDVPDVQIIVLDDLDRQFIAYVEKAFNDRGVRCDVLILSPRLSELAVVRRQIVEGVLAVVRLTRSHMATGKVSLQLFNHSRGVGSVSFEEYENLDPPVATELVMRAKNTNRAPSKPSYPVSYGIPANYGMAPPVPPTQSQHAPMGDLSSILAQLGSRPGTDLQGLLANINSQATPGALNASTTADIARFLGGASTQSTQGYGQPAQQPIDFSAFLGNSQQPVPQQVHYAGQNLASSAAAPPPQPDMQQIMAQLAKYQR